MASQVSQVLLLAVVAVTFPTTIASRSRLEEAVSKFETVPGTSELARQSGVTVHPPVDLSKDRSSPYKDAFDDPYWNEQWYAQDYRTENTPVMDLNLVPVYRMGITGKDVVVAVVDDGVDETQPDLDERTRKDLSYDLCSMRAGCVPDDEDDIYGTMAAGIIAMQADNKECGVGVAYGAKIAGVQFSCYYLHRDQEPLAIGYKTQEIDISLNLWGGKIMSHHSPETEAAFSKGITTGRGGKGLIYVFGGGINGNQGIQCCGNSLLQVPDIIVVNGASPTGKRLSYAQRCSSIMATTYALEDEENGPGLVVPLPGGSCSVTKEHGPWAACAFAAGVIALVLEARPELTYRDVMHIIAMGAEVAPLADNPDTWDRNGKGFWFSNDFGFGLLNAENMVHLAKKWVLVPKKNICKATVTVEKQIKIDFGVTREIGFRMEEWRCKDNKVNYLEHVVVWLNIGYRNRGALEVVLVSPQGTVVTIMERQTGDTAQTGLKNWRVTSLGSWGENAVGIWRLRVTAKDPPRGFWNLIGAKVEIKDFKIELHGTANPPEYHARLPRSYTAFRLPDGRTSKDRFPLFY